MNKILPLQLSANELDEWLHDDSISTLLIDVREDQELEIASFPFEVLHLPLSKSIEWIDTLDSKLSQANNVVVICHSGIRSWNFGIWLLEQSIVKEVWNLSGGIDAWSVKIDPSIARY